MGRQSAARHRHLQPRQEREDRVQAPAAGARRAQRGLSPYRPTQRGKRRELHATLVGHERRHEGQLLVEQSETRLYRRSAQREVSCLRLSPTERIRLSRTANREVCVGQDDTRVRDKRREEEARGGGRGCEALAAVRQRSPRSTVRRAPQCGRLRRAGRELLLRRPLPAQHDIQGEAPQLQP